LVVSRVRELHSGEEWNAKCTAKLKQVSKSAHKALFGKAFFGNLQPKQTTNNQPLQAFARRAAPRPEAAAVEKNLRHVHGLQDNV